MQTTQSNIGVLLEEKQKYEKGLVENVRKKEYFKQQIQKTFYLEENDNQTKNTSNCSQNNACLGKKALAQRKKEKESTGLEESEEKRGERVQSVGEENQVYV